MISEEKLSRQLDYILSADEPGAAVHHLHLLAGKPGPLGLPDEQDQKLMIYALAPVGRIDAESFLTQSLMTAALERRAAGEVIVFAAFAKLLWLLPQMDELGRELRAAGRLHEHPEVFEGVTVYAACRDGRRWRGRRAMSGENAGQSQIDLVVGRLTNKESEDVGVRNGQVIRAMVGL